MSKIRGKVHRPYLIAEAGVNHEGDLEVALEMVRAVARSGWNAIKFQTYTAEKLASKNHSRAYWDTTEEPETSQFKLFSKFRALSETDYDAIRQECARHSVEFLTTYFSIDDMLTFGKALRFVKVASADISNVPLLRAAGSVSREILLSVGAASDEEIEFAVNTLRAVNSKIEITLLHCILNYPTAVNNANLFRIPHLFRTFPGLKVGYSDHTKFVPGSPNASVLSVALGATVIEKHFSLDLTKSGNDHYHSADESGLKEIRERIDVVCELVGDESNDVLAIQKQAREEARRRVFSKHPLPRGHKITEDDVIPLRGSMGLSASLWDSIIGSVTRREIGAGDPLLETDIG